MMRFHVLSIMFLVAASGAVVRADEIVLKSGRTIQGRVLSRAGKKVTLSIAGGTMTLHERQILEIREERFVYARSQVERFRAPPVIKTKPKPQRARQTSYRGSGGGRFFAPRSYRQNGRVTGGSPWARNRARRGTGLQGRNGGFKRSGRRGRARRNFRRNARRSSATRRSSSGRSGNSRSGLGR